MRVDIAYETIKEYDRQTPLTKFNKKSKVFCFGRYRYDQPIYRAGGEILQVQHFPVEGFPALGDDYIITIIIGNGFNPIDGLRKKTIGYFRYDHPNGTASSFLQTQRNGVR